MLSEGFYPPSKQRLHTPERRPKFAPEAGVFPQTTMFQGRLLLVLGSVYYSNVLFT